MLTIERAATPLTIRAVRCALFAEKTTPMDPRLATDTQKIGEQEAAKIKAGKVPQPKKGILKSQGQGVTGVSFYGTEWVFGFRYECTILIFRKRHLEVRPSSEEFTIGCEPYNPLFFQKVKQRGPETSGTAATSTETNTCATSTTTVAKTQTDNEGGDSPSQRKIKTRGTGTKDDDSKRATTKRTTPPPPPAPTKPSGTEKSMMGGVDLEMSSKGKKEEDSKRGESGKTVRSMYGATPAPPPPAPELEERKSEKSKKEKKGGVGKNAAPAASGAPGKSVANKKARNCESQKRK